MTKVPTSKPSEVDNFRISVTEAEQLIAKHLPAAPAVTVSLAEANQHILREAVYAERDQPPFHRATMDGIAIAAGEAQADEATRFSIAGIQAAGQAAANLPPDCCIEVMTGAVVPSGANTVIPVERITVANGIAEIEPGYAFKPGQFVHLRGSDHHQGDPLLPIGIQIGPPEMAVLAAAGKASVRVSATPKVAVISTGDELVDVGLPISDSQIRSSNDRAIAAALQQAGASNVSRHSYKDDPEQLRNGIRQLLANNDMLVLSGGVSMGKYDYLPQVLAELGIRVIFHKITQRPGLPMWFGMSADNKPVFALPGNPVSALVCLTRYVLPAIQQSLLANSNSNHEQVALAQPLSFGAELSWFVPVTLEYAADGRTLATPRLTNTSGDFCALSGTAGFIELPCEANDFPAGYVARLFRW